MSHTEFSAKVIAKACQAWIRNLDEVIECERERLIEEAMKPGWFRKARTREQAIDALENEEFSLYNLLESTDYFRREKVRNLQALSEAAPKGQDKVFVSAEDLYIIKEFLN